MFVFTLWYGPNDGNEVLAIIQSSLERFVEETPSAPNGWPPLRYADEAMCATITDKYGFGAPSFERLPTVYHMSSGEEMLRLLDTLSSRSKFILDNQSPSTQERIRSSILSDTESHRSEHGISLAFPAMLALARKPK